MPPGPKGLGGIAGEVMPPRFSRIPLPVLFFLVFLFFFFVVVLDFGGLKHG